MDALHRALQSSEQLSATVVVEANDGQTLAFYRMCGFIDLPNIERRLFLPMATIAQMLSGDE